MIYVSILFIVGVATLLHFVYHWSNHNKIVAVFAAVNESTWEHIKIGMTPTLLWCFYDVFVFGSNPNYIVAKTLSILTIIFVIPILFYSYTFFTKKAYLPIDIICFCITILLSQTVFYQIIEAQPLPMLSRILSIIVFIFEIIAYLTLTMKPLKNFLFKDPITHKYGLEGHPEFHHHEHIHSK